MESSDGQVVSFVEEIGNIRMYINREIDAIDIKNEVFLYFILLFILVHTRKRKRSDNWMEANGPQDVTQVGWRTKVCRWMRTAFCCGEDYSLFYI